MSLKKIFVESKTQLLYAQNPAKQMMLNWNTPTMHNFVLQDNHNKLQ